MLPALRRERILREVQDQGTTSIAELSRRYGVSEMTIRRDLQALADAGQIRRTHGGALRQSEAAIEPRYAAKQDLNAATKAAIAHYAASQLVEDGDIIILEGGTTVTTMARHLAARRGLTILTNGLYTTNELRRLMPDATIICCGGILRDVSFTFVGPSAERFFAEVHARTVFLSSTGLSVAAGCTDPNMGETQVKRAMIASASRLVALLDSSKFGVTSLVTVAQVDDIDVLVTDAAAPPAARQALQARGVDVRVA
ncbi:MAG: DeoR/GlpR transcriptional regulator [Kouleothrix sp.]|nr:DeoR/GlpR transcriptional regulator [Kouleothrix sp.]